jgi:hypothetical protein
VSAARLSLISGRTEEYVLNETDVDKVSPPQAETFNIVRNFVKAHYELLYPALGVPHGTDYSERKQEARKFK